MDERICSIPDCGREFYAKGFCSRHWERNHRTGNPLGVPKPSISERFWAKVNKTETCWLWTANATPLGYGCFTAVKSQGQVYAHRFAYEQLVGPIPKGLVIDHLCRTPGCVNPTHLEPVTQQVNVLRGRRSALKEARP